MDDQNYHNKGPRILRSTSLSGGPRGLKSDSMHTLGGLNADSNRPSAGLVRAERSIFYLCICGPHPVSFTSNCLGCNT